MGRWIRVFVEEEDKGDYNGEGCGAVILAFSSFILPFIPLGIGGNAIESIIALICCLLLSVFLCFKVWFKEGVGCGLVVLVWTFIWIGLGVFGLWINI